MGKQKQALATEDFNLLTKKTQGNVKVLATKLLKMPFKSYFLIIIPRKLNNAAVEDAVSCSRARKQ